MNAARNRLRKLLVWGRDRYLATHIFRIKATDGFIPYAKNDQVGKKVWLRGGYEEAERAILRKLCRASEKAVFFDIGANSGLFTLLAAKAIPGGQVHSFEASQFEFRKLVTTAEWNRLENVRLNNAAVSDSVGYLTIHETYSGGGALNRMDGPHKPGGRFRLAVVPSLTIDHYADANALTEVHFMKIDVEGHEMSVLQGGLNTLTRTPPILLIECEHRRSSASSTPEKIIGFVENIPGAGYEGFLAGDRGFTSLSKLGEGNIFFVPKEKQADVRKVLGWT